MASQALSAIVPALLLYELSACLCWASFRSDNFLKDFQKESMVLQEEKNSAWDCRISCSTQGPHPEVTLLIMIS